MKVPLRSRQKVTRAELQTALKLDPESDVYCLAFLTGSRICNEKPTCSPVERDPILDEIAQKITENGLAIASNRMTALLENLASTLLCYKNKHPMQAPLRDGRRRDQEEYVTQILRDRLKDFEKARLARRNAEAFIRSRSHSGRKGKGRAFFPDESDGHDTRSGGHSDNRSSDGEVSEHSLDDESTSALAHRPKAIPRHQAVARSDQHSSKSQIKTPNRVQQRPSGSGRRRQQSDDSDDSDGSTPGTAVSEVFSAASSKWSPTTVPPNRSLTSRHKQHNETPTRRRRVIEVTDIDTESASEDVDEIGMSDGSASSPSSTSQVAVKHEKSAIKAAYTEDDESSPETIIAFGRPDSNPGTPNYILDLMLNRIKEAPHGYVYCFSQNGAKGFLKIGFSGIKDLRTMQSPDEVPIDIRDNRSRQQLWERLESQQKRCKFNMQFEFDVYMPSAAERMERLIHATLQEHNRVVTRCRNPDCKIKHKEWFEVSLSEAKFTIDMWKKFSKLKPWAANGTLTEEWSNYARKNLANNSFGKLSVETWFHKEWEETLNRARRHQRERRKASDAEIKKAGEGVAEAEHIYDEKQRLLNREKLYRADRQLSVARWEVDQAREQVEEEKRKLALLEKRRTTLG